MRKFKACLSLCAMGALSLTAFAARQDAQDLPANGIGEEFPGTRVMLDNGRVRTMYGKPMTQGATAQDAADRFLNDHLAEFGAPNFEVHQMMANDVAAGRLTVFTYNQTMEGLPVEHGLMRVAVNNDLDRVVYASATLAVPPMDEEGVPYALEAATLTASDAVDLASNLQDYSNLPLWSEPTQVVFFGEGDWAAPRRAWKFVGEDLNLETREKYTFFVDAANGAVLHVRNEIMHVDVSGTVTGNLNANDAADRAGNPETVNGLGEILVRIAGGASAYTDRFGNFTVPHSGTSTVSVSADLDEGMWVNVNDASGRAIQNESVSVTPPGPADPFFNSPINNLDTAQLNAFYHTTLTHNHFKDRAPSHTNIDIVMPARVNIGLTCNAYFDGSSINFYQAGGGCANTSYGSVVSHEYGHFIVQTLGLGQGGFGEGFSDTMSMMIYDTPIIGEGFLDSGDPVREPLLANVQYPCDGTSVHYCGQILGALWWEIRANMGVTYGEPMGFDLARQLHVDWAQITGGGTGSNFLNSANPNTVIEILTVDDDDADFDNGTPNFMDICAAVVDRGLDCPEIAPALIEFPNGRSDTVSPDAPTVFEMTASGLGAQPIAGTGQLIYSISGGAPQTVALTETSPNHYLVELPAVDCNDSFDYYIQVDSTAGLAASPADAPTIQYSAIPGTSTLEAENNTFELSDGWARDTVNDTALTGLWTRMDPEETSSSGGLIAQPEDDFTPSGTDCWVTDGNAGASLGANDVDGGATSLLSPVYDLSGYNDAVISFWLWYSNNTGAAPSTDYFRVFASDDGGANWTQALEVGPAGVGTTGGWRFHQFLLSDAVGTSSQVQLRFQAEDANPGSIVEAAMDDFLLTAVSCAPAPSCTGDLDSSGEVDSTDLGILLGNFGTTSGASATDGDVDGDGDIDSDDLAILLGVFGSTCS